LLCRAVVETPIKLNKKQKALLEQFQESLGQGGHAQSPRQSSWLDGVKNFFDDMKV
jgi:molecular chaperone DnaJ